MRLFLTQGVSKTLRKISAILPQHTRRLVLWGALYSKMCGSHNFTQEQSDRLNKALSLCKDNAALILPAPLGKYLWPDLDKCSIAARKAIRGEEPVEVAAQAFVHGIPLFLRYANEAFMLKDFESLLATHRQAAHA